MAQFNAVYVRTATIGAITLVLGAVVSPRFCTLAEAGAANGDEIRSYIIEEGNDFEIGVGIYNSIGPTLTRPTVRLSRIAGVVGTTKMTLAGNATVRVIAAAEDLVTQDTAGSVALRGAATLNLNFPAPLAHPPILGLGSVFTASGRNGENAFFNVICYGTPATPGGGPSPAFITLKANGTQDAPSAVKKDNIIGFFSAVPFGQTKFCLGGGQILFAAEDDYTDTYQPGRMDVQLSPPDYVPRLGATPDVVTFLRVDQFGTMALGPNVATISNPITTLISPINAIFKAAMGTDANTFTDLFSFGTGLPGYVTHAARGTQDLPTALHSGDFLGIVQFGGRDDVGWASLGGAQIRAKTTQPWEAGKHGSRLSLFITPNDTNAEVEAVWVNQSGGVGIGTDTDPGVGGLALHPGSSITPAANGDLVFEATSNTSFKIKYKGSDGTVRSNTLTLS